MTDWSDNPDNNMLLGTTTAENVPEAEPMPEATADAAKPGPAADASRKRRQPVSTITLVEGGTIINPRYDAAGRLVGFDGVKGGRIVKKPLYEEDMQYYLRIGLSEEEKAKAVTIPLKYLTLPSAKQNEDAYTSNRMFRLGPNRERFPVEPNSVPDWFLDYLQSHMNTHHIEDGHLIIDLSSTLDKDFRKDGKEGELEKSKKSVAGGRDTKLESIEEFVYDLEEAFFNVWETVITTTYYKDRAGKRHTKIKEEAVKVLSVEAFDPHTGIIKVYSPLIERLLSQPVQEYLAASALAAQGRNPAAYQMAKIVLARFKPYTHTKRSTPLQLSFKTLYEKAPAFRAAIEASPDHRARNIRRAIDALLKLLNRHSRIFLLHTGVEILLLKENSLTRNKTIISSKDITWKNLFSTKISISYQGTKKPEAVPTSPDKTK